MFYISHITSLNYKNYLYELKVDNVCRYSLYFNWYLRLVVLHIHFFCLHALIFTPVGKCMIKKLTSAQILITHLTKFIKF